MTEPSLRAEIFVPTPEIVSAVVEHCSQHRPWFSDWAWENPDRRAITTTHIAKLYAEMQRGEGFLWSIWRGADLVGIINIRDTEYRTNASCHFIFFDRRLADKRDLCLALIAWCFDKLELHRLSVEIPTYARALVKFARKLGFRYEAENRQPYTHKDERLEPLGLAKAYIGSRRFQATLYEGQWHDALLLSLFREEFDLGRRESQSS